MLSKDYDSALRRQRLVDWRVQGRRAQVPFSKRFESPLERNDDVAILTHAKSLHLNAVILFQVTYFGWCRESNDTDDEHLEILSTVEIKWVDLKSEQIVWYGQGMAEVKPPHPIDITSKTPPFNWALTADEAEAIRRSVEEAFANHESPLTR